MTKRVVKIALKILMIIRLKTKFYYK